MLNQARCYLSFNTEKILSDSPDFQSTWSLSTLETGMVGLGGFEPPISCSRSRRVSRYPTARDVSWKVFRRCCSASSSCRRSSRRSGDPGGSCFSSSDDCRRSRRTWRAISAGAIGAKTARRMAFTEIPVRNFQQRLSLTTLPICGPVHQTNSAQASRLWKLQRWRSRRGSRADRETCS